MRLLDRQQSLSTALPSPTCPKLRLKTHDTGLSSSALLSRPSGGGQQQSVKGLHPWLIALYMRPRIRASSLARQPFFCCIGVCVP